MRLSQTPPTLVSLLLVVLSQTDTTKAAPHLRGVRYDELQYGHLQDRRGLVNCGAQGQYTCTGAEACYTNAAQVAYCSVPNNEAATTGGSGGYAVYTTTYTETDLVLRTSTYSSWYQTTATSNWVPSASAAVCDTTQGQSSCGAICCASNQYCAYLGACAPIAVVSTATIASTAIETSTYSAPLRPTSGGASTTTVSASTTVPFISPATASGSSLPIVSTSTSHKLSGGAIAGIVIGTIAAVILLLLICFCCIVKAGFDGLLAIFGLGSRNKKRSRERIEITEERYSRHGSGTASRRDTHTGWFRSGGRPARVTETRKKKKSGGFGGMGAVGAGLLGLAVILGLKRRHDKKEMVQRERSDIGSSYYTDSYTGTSASSASSDRRTRESRHTRR